MDLDKAFEAFKFTQAAFSGILAGSALYITLIEHPARMEVKDTESVHKQWLESFNRAKRYMAVGSLFPMASGVACYAIDQKKGLPFMLVAGSLLFNLPYSLIFLIPNYVTPIMDEDTVTMKKKPEKVVREMVDNWGFYHGVRTIVDVGAFIFCVYNIVYDS
ncbi:predicted protein [Nematostella vectensis]|uniref:DUF1772 domain-containing protein n=1 Tax=Nematostella vectensis TaxID=45351 RepID=A7TCD1_NEMVE|nr:predicted protein [Nematostella vectensis]|eukprot:XP_001618402.1 hypothetical protein NEMVEDRAFT_v1g225191 [Nematostella vectensis]